jgi:hypothetical protein
MLSVEEYLTYIADTSLLTAHKLDEAVISKDDTNAS